MKQITEQEWETIKENLWTDFLQNASAEEIHKSVMTSNWDDCKTLLKFITDNPEKIDKATALLAYWKSQPDWFKKFENEQDYINKEGYNLFLYHFLEKVEHLFSQNNYAKSIIYFDPKSCEFYEEIRNEAILNLIPEIMKQSTGNQYVEYPEDFEDGLPFPIAQKLFDLLDEYEIM